MERHSCVAVVEGLARRNLTRMRGADILCTRSVAHTRNDVDDSPAPCTPLVMGRPKQFDERIQLTLVEGTTGRIDALLDGTEYRLDFIRTAIEAEISKRVATLPERKRQSFLKKTS